MPSKRASRGSSSAEKKAKGDDSSAGATASQSSEASVEVGTTTTTPHVVKGKEGGRVVLVTGGTGLVGKGIEEALATRPLAKQGQDDTWIFLSSKDCDLMSKDATRALFERFKPSYVLHIAAKVGGLFANQSQKVGKFFFPKP